MIRDSAFLRGQLLSVGIVLEPSTVGAGPRASSPPAADAVDRDEVRRILVDAGAPPWDLDWLVASCPGLDAARGYRAPARRAWCLDCGEATECDDDGCLTCRRTT